jgi:murein L,D-transpeptidase YcbB/YkuD
VTNLFARTLCAALLVSAVPAAALAAPAEGSGSATVSSAGVSEELRSKYEIPASGRFVLVDAASAQLFMIEDGRVQDKMRVIVGKPTAATPVLKSKIYAATLNPYCHVPTDLARSIIAPRVLKDGMTYLRERGYEVVSDFNGGRILDPESVNWTAVADGQEKVYVRQLPGPANSMGEMKFAFPNAEGIYLHDTPRKELFAEAARNLSAGCVRLEDADRLAKWLLGRNPSVSSSAPEQEVALAAPVPISITYMDTSARMQLAGL